MGRSTRIQNSADDLDDLEKLYAAREFSKPSETLRGAQASQNFICGRWKIIIALGFLTCAAVAPAILYIYLSQQEASNFNTAYTTLTNELQATIRSNLYNKYFSVNELSTLYSSIPNVVWPDVLYPLFYPVASNLCASSDCYQISFHPLVNSSSSRLYAWEQYVNTIKEDWKASQGLPPDIFIDNEIYSGFRNLQASLTNDSFALPKWQVFPFSPYEQSSLLLNSLDSPSYRSSILPLLTGNASSSLLFGTESSPEFIELSYPIFNLIPSANSSSPIVGIINLIFEQGSLFSGLTFADEGILCDIQLPSTSSSESTTSVFFFLSRDQVDRISDPSIWSDLSNSRVLNITSFYPISPGARETLEIVVTTYPSRSYTSNYITNWPLIYAFLLGSFVMIVWLVFFVYDYTVTIKINSLTTLANSATTVVDELFPSFVRDRLYRLKRSGTSAEALMLLDSPKSFTQPDMVTEDEELGQLQRLRRNSLDHIMATLTSTRRRHRSSVSTLSTSGDTFEPIAKLFQHATVLFADVAGFTKWSAQRSPADVFDLLESLFLIFDRAAEKRGVFKIETIGDW